MIYIFLLMFLVAFIYKVYINKQHNVKVSPLTKQEQFIEELFERFGGDSKCDYLFIQRPKNKSEVLECKKICEKYGYNYYMLFKHIKKDFWNYERYFMGWQAHFDKGTLTLVELKPGETNLK